jgi:hypothetical protein
VGTSINDVHFAILEAIIVEKLILWINLQDVICDRLLWKKYKIVSHFLCSRQNMTLTSAVRKERKTLQNWRKIICMCESLCSSRVISESPETVVFTNIKKEQQA